MLPKNTELGTLGYLEVYDYYDFPQFFSCENESGIIFLGLAIEDDPLIFLFTEVDQAVINRTNFIEELPVKIMREDGKSYYKIQILDTEDTLTRLNSKRD